MELVIFSSVVIAFIVLVAVIVGVIAIARLSSPSGDPGIGTTRRIFLYGLSFVSLMLTASGLTLIVDSIADSLLGGLLGSNITTGGSDSLAFGLAATLIGFPTWALLWRAAQRTVERHPVEAGTLSRKIYVYLVLAVAVGVVGQSAILIVGSILDLRNFDPSGFATPLVWAGVWIFHWRIEKAEGQPSLAATVIRHIYVYATSIYGLALLAGGTAALVGSLFGAAYDALFANVVIADEGGILARVSFNASTLLIGAGLWWSHWGRISRADAGSDIRQAVVYVVGIFGGTVASVTALSAILVTLISWPLDPSPGRQAAAHFDSIPASIAVLLVTVTIAAYYTAVGLSEAEGDPERSARAQRAYRYLSAAVGLGTLWVALTLLIAIFLGLIVPSAQGSLTGERWWGLPLSISITLLLVGAVLWTRHWPRIQAAAQVDTDARTSLARRAYLFAAFGLAVLATLGSLSALLFIVFEAALNGTLSTAVLDGGKWSFGVVLTAGIVSVYHWLVLREDARAAPAQVPPRLKKRVSALAADSGADILAELEQALDLKITRRRRADDPGAPSLTAAQLASLVEQITAAPGDEVVLVIESDGVRAIPL